jgi:hypothetical protein
VFPAASRARAVTVCEPLAAVVVVHGTLYGAAISSAPSVAPSSRNCTPTTPTLSDAFAVTVVVPDTVAPEAGAVTLAVGAVVSFDTVTVLGSDDHVAPSGILATAVKVCGPLPVVLEFHEMEYGAAVSSAPRFAPSSLNWTPATVSAPIIVTLALTVVEPVIVACCAGAVIVTTRLPSCADAEFGVHRQPTASSTANRAALAQPTRYFIFMIAIPQLERAGVRFLR